MRQLPAYLLLALLALLLLQCAQQQPLQGGPKDEQPPELDLRRYSTPNYQTNFKEKEILLTFNEWVQLKNAQQQILISPPLDKKPKVKVKNKTVILRFQEELKENTTYSIQFGQSIVDFREGNPVKDLRFVFSTGPQLDSLQLGGQLFDAKTAAPVAEAWVMLYEGELGDSTPILQRPNYLAQTDEKGNFKLENLKAGRYILFGLMDKNNDYRYQANEELAFWSEPIILTDSSAGNPKLRLFAAAQEQKLVSAKQLAQQQGQLQFLNPFSDSLKIQPLEELEDWTYYQNKEFVWLFWKGAQGEELRFVLEAGDYRDTAKINLYTGLDPSELRLIDPKKAGKARATEGLQIPLPILHPKNPMQLDFGAPIQRIDTSLCVWQNDTGLSLGPLSFQPAGNYLWTLEAPKAPSATYSLQLLPGALTDFWGQQNEDTLKASYALETDKTLGNILAQIQNVDSSKQYVFELRRNQEEVVHRQLLLGQSQYALNFPLLPAGNYQIQLIWDENQDGQWTTGNYLKLKQAEKISSSKELPLRPGWDNEISLDLKED